MTTIAANKTSIACDLMMTHSSGLALKSSSKVLEVPGHLAQEMFGVKKALIGFAGSTEEWGNVVNFIAMGGEGKLPRLRHTELLMLNPEGLWHSVSLSNWTKVNDPYFSIGSGMQYAMGALASGKSPLEACKVAAKFDKSTGIGFKEFKL